MLTKSSSPWIRHLECDRSTTVIWHIDEMNGDKAVKKISGESQKDKREKKVRAIEKRKRERKRER